MEKNTPPKSEMTMAQRRRNHPPSFVDANQAPTLHPPIPAARAYLKNFNIDLVDQR